MLNRLKARTIQNRFQNLFPLHSFLSARLRRFDQLLTSSSGFYSDIQRSLRPSGTTLNDFCQLLNISNWRIKSKFYLSRHFINKISFSLTNTQNLFSRILLISTRPEMFWSPNHCLIFSFLVTRGSLIKVPLNDTRPSDCLLLRLLQHADVPLKPGDRKTSISQTQNPITEPNNASVTGLNAQLSLDMDTTCEGHGEQEVTKQTRFRKH